MTTIAKAVAIIAGGVLAIYVVVFLAVLPLMAKAPAGATGSMAAGIYAALYRPVRDALPDDNVIHQVWRDYENYWCAGSPRCAL